MDVFYFDWRCWCLYAVLRMESVGRRGDAAGRRAVRAMLHRVEGIVIRTVDYGEGGVVLTLFTGDRGKVGLMARGAKKPRSRYAAAAQLYTYGEYAYFKTASGSLGALNDADILDSFASVRADLRCSAYAAYFAEMTDRMVPEGEAGEFLFAQLRAALEALALGKDPKMIACLLELKLFHAAGIAPVLDRCSACGCEPGPEEGAGWSVSAGGVLCRRCSGAYADASKLAPGLARLMLLMQRADLRQIGEIHVKPETKAAIRQALRRWMDYHADVRLKTRGVLEQIEAVYDN